MDFIYGLWMTLDPSEMTWDILTLRVTQGWYPKICMYSHSDQQKCKR